MSVSKASHGIVLLLAIGILFAAGCGKSKPGKVKSISKEEAAEKNRKRLEAQKIEQRKKQAEAGNKSLPTYPPPAEFLKNKNAKKNFVDLTTDSGEYFIVNYLPTQAKTAANPDQNFSGTRGLQKDANAIELRFHQPAMAKLELALQNSKNKSEKLALAKEVIDLMTFNINDYDEERKQDLAKRAELLASENPETEDPFFNTLIATTFVGTDNAKAFKYADAAIKGFHDSDYPAGMVFQAHFVRCNSNWRYKRMRSAHLGQMAECLMYWLVHDLRQSADDYRILVSRIEPVIANYEGQRDKLEQLIEIFSRERRIPQYLKEMALGMANYRLAWDARGDGYISRVTERGRIEFERFQRKAAIHFKNAHRINPAFPEAATKMIAVTRGGNVNESAEDWFRKATEAQFDFAPAYKQMLFTLEPKWYGSVEKLLEFGRKCLATNRYDTNVPLYYLLAVNKACLSLSGGSRAYEKLFADNKSIYPNLVKCIETYADSATSPTGVKSKKHLYSSLAGYAYHQRNFEDMKKYFDLVGDDLSADGFQTALVPFSTDVAKALMSVVLSHGMEKMVAFHKEIGEADTPEKRKATYDRIQTKLLETTDPHEQLFWKMHARKLNNIKKFEDGDWVDEIFELKTANFNSYMNSYAHVEDANSIEIRMPIKATSYMFSFDSFMPGPKIIEYELEPTKILTENSELASGRRGFYPGIQLQSSRGRVMRIVHDLQGNYVIFSGGRLGYRSLVSHGEGKFQIRCGGNFIEIHHGDQLVFRNRLTNIEDAARLGLMTGNRTTGNGHVRYRNLRIKKWELGPPPISLSNTPVTPEKLLEYHRKGAELEPDRGEHWTQIGMLEHQLGNFEAARNAFDEALKKGQSKRYIGFFLGDMLERDGKLDQAKQEYFAAANLGVHYDIEPLNYTKKGWPNPQRMAALRYSWLFLTDETNTQMSSDQAFEHLKNFTDLPGRKLFPEWAVRRVEAARFAKDGLFSDAIKCMQNLPRVPTEFRGEVNRQLAAYRNGELYSRDSNKPIFYLSLNVPTYHYRYWDELYPQEMQNADRN